MARRCRFIVMVLAVGIILAYSPPFASADTILTYTGNPFNTFSNTTTTLPSYDTTMFVSIWLDLANPLGPNWNLMQLFGTNYPLHWMVSDGMDVISDTSPFIPTKFDFSTDATGAITAWLVRIGLADSPREIQSIAGLAVLTTADFGSICQSNGISLCQQHDIGSISSSPGTWTVSVTAPEPSTLNYLIVAVSGLGFCLRKRLS